jgi:peptidoglycan hydrolase-like protein with peptidoglycan-binding domain
MNRAPAENQKNPFPGLRPFREDEEYLFFGRENQVDAMVDKLAATRFLAVVGTSGSGKSSLVNCGLRPALHGGLMARAGTAWRMAQFRPGSNPMRAMARALAEDGVLFKDYQAAGLTLAEIVDTTLRMSSLGLIDIYEQAQLGEDVNLLVVVDQFEELFRYRQFGAGQQQNGTGVSEEATAFVNLLLAVKEQTKYPIYVVLTMRSDFLGDCTQFTGLAETINAGQYLVPRMTRDERRAAIGGPVGVGGAESSPVLLTRLVNDVGDNPDQLSILQHSLNRTWNQWERSGGKGPLDLPHYEAIGTMAHALDQHAERAYAELTTARQQLICEKLFKALTDKATDPRGVRRPSKLGTLCALTEATPAEVTQVIDVFRQPSRSFLMPPAGDTLEAETVIDISHESLMRVWERLKTWADEEAQSAHIYRRLAETAVLHGQGKAGLWNDPDLQVALDWHKKNEPNKDWARRYVPEFDLAMKFLDRSAAARKRAVTEKETQRRRAIRRTRLTAAVFAVLFLVSAVALVFARQQSRRADDALKLVENNAEFVKNNAVKAARADEQRQIAAMHSLESEKLRRKAEDEREEAIKQKGIAEKKTTEATQQRQIAERLGKEALEQKRIAEQETAKVAELERQASKEKDAAKQINTLKRAIDDALVSNKNEGDIRKEVITNATLLLENYRKGGDVRGEYESATILGSTYLSDGQHAKAREYAKNALAIQEKQQIYQRGEHENLRVLRDAYLKEADQKEGKPREQDLLNAFTTAENALAVNKRSLGPNNPALIPDLSSLASVSDRRGQYDASERYRGSIVEIQKKTLGVANSQLVRYLNDLATFYQARGNYSAAEARLKEILTIQRNTLAADDPQLAATLNSLVAVYRYEKKDAEADLLVKQMQGLQGQAALLQKGSSGSEVKKLQLQLQKLGFYKGTPDEYFGESTATAVSEFQKSQGLVADGIAGPRTLSLLEEPQPKAIGAMEIQAQLQKLGFYEGALDGVFGMRSKAALMSFQRSKGLVPDGVATPETLEALGLKTATKTTSITGKVTVDIVAKMFPGVPIDNIKANLPFILRALEDAALSDKEMVLLALANMRADGGDFTPFSESNSRFNTSPDGHPFDLYDNRGGNQGPPDGERFRGRGYVQLWGRANYAQYGNAIGLGNQLVENPELANQPDIAARLLASYLKQLEPRLRRVLVAGDLAQARKALTGGLNGFDEFRKAFQTGASLLQ